MFGTMMVLSRRELLGIVAAATAASCGVRQARSTLALPRLIVLVTLDTTRRDNLQAYGYRQPNTPNLSALAGRGVLFTRAYTQANETQTSHAVMLSGLYSHLNGSYRNLQRWSLPPGYRPLAEVLSANGFRTIATTSFGALTARMIGDGFGQFSFPDGRERRARETNQIVFETLSQRRKSDRIFLWTHFFDAHEPYDPPADHKVPFANKGYDAPGMYEYDCQLSYLDSQIGELLAYLRREQLYDDAAILVTSDHGEHFGETPELPLRAHYGLYSYILRAPLILAGGWVERWRAVAGVSATCSQIVSSGITVAPTVLEWAGVASDKPLSGYSLLPVVDGRQASSGAHLAESDSRMQVAVRTNRYKLIVLNSNRYEEDLRRLAAHDPNVYVTAQILERARHRMSAEGLELYDMEADPGERVNLAGRQQPIVARHLAILARMHQQAATTRTAEPETDRLGILRSLGYIK